MKEKIDFTKAGNYFKILSQNDLPKPFIKNIICTNLLFGFEGFLDMLDVYKKDVDGCDIETKQISLLNLIHILDVAYTMLNNGSLGIEKEESDEIKEMHKEDKEILIKHLIKTLTNKKLTKFNSFYEKVKVTKQNNYELYLAKNKKYGDAYYEGVYEYGLNVALYTMDTKYKRIKQMYENSITDCNESILDSIQDYSNYASMTLALLKTKIIKN